MSFLNNQKQNPEFLNNYLKYQRFIRGESETTVDETYIDLRMLFRFIKLYLYEKEKLENITRDEIKQISIKEITIEDLNQIKQQDLDNYLLFVNHKLNNSAKTQNRKLASVKGLFEYLSTTNQINSNPAKGLKGGFVGKRNPKYLTLQKSKELLSSSIKSEQRNKIRNYAITCLFLNCFLRVSEVVKIDIADLKIDDSEQTIIIHGKGNKERMLYLNAAVCEAIKEYMKIREEIVKENPNCDRDALFLSSRNKRISKRTIQTIIKDEFRKAFGENGNDYHTHTLRHTGPSILYEYKDVNIFVLKQILGHKCLEATEVYTHVPDNKLREIMENCTISSIIEKRKV